MKATWSTEEEALRLAERFVGVNQAEFARNHNVPGGPSMVSQHIKGRRPLNLAAATAYASGFNCALEEISPRLAAEVAEAGRLTINPKEIDLSAHPDLVPIRRVRLKLQAGINGFAIEPESGDGVPIFFRADWLRERGYRSDALLALKVNGPSMEPTLYAGDMVVVNTLDREPRDGRVFAVNYEGEDVIKRVQRDGGNWWLCSDNPDQRRFPRKAVSDSSAIIIGIVVHRQSEFL